MHTTLKIQSLEEIQYSSTIWCILGIDIRRIIITYNKVVYKLNITFTPIYAVKSLLTLTFLNPLEIGNSRGLGWDTSCFL